MWIKPWIKLISTGCIAGTTGNRQSAPVEGSRVRAAKYTQKRREIIKSRQHWNIPPVADIFRHVSNANTTADGDLRLRSADPSALPQPQVAA